MTVDTFAVAFDLVLGFALVCFASFHDGVVCAARLPAEDHDVLMYLLRTEFGQAWATAFVFVPDQFMSEPFHLAGNHKTCKGLATKYNDVAFGFDNAFQFSPHGLEIQYLVPFNAGSAVWRIHAHHINRLVG